MNIVKELRQKAGIQQKQLAVEIGVSRPTVCDWEKNRKDPSGERLRRLAEYFNVDELLVLGKGIVDVTKEAEPPKTDEARIISAAVDRLPKAERKRALEFLRVLYSNKPDLFDDSVSGGGKTYQL